MNHFLEADCNQQIKKHRFSRLASFFEGIHNKNFAKNPKQIQRKLGARNLHSDPQTAGRLEETERLHKRKPN